MKTLNLDTRKAQTTCSPEFLGGLMDKGYWLSAVPRSVLVAHALECGNEDERFFCLCEVFAAMTYEERETFLEKAIEVKAAASAVESATIATLEMP